MTKRFSLFFLLMLFMVNHICAQIQGVVTDADTGEPLPFLSVFMKVKV
jgi:hypothetical protein